MYWVLLAGGGVLTTLGAALIRAWTRRASSPAEAAAAPIIDLEGALEMETREEEEPTLIDPPLKPFHAPVTKYARWAEECRERVGIVDSIETEIVDPQSGSTRIVFRLDTGEHVNAWVAGPEWMGPFPRLRNSSWNEAHSITAEDTQAGFERALLLARSRQFDAGEAQQ